MIIPDGAYGERTAALQQEASLAESITLFSPGMALDQANLADPVREHMRRMAIRGVRHDEPRAVQVVRGSARTLMEHWQEGAVWRAAVGETLGAMHRRYSARPYSEMVRPPLWPVAGLINVFGPVFVANEVTRRRCEAAGRTATEVETCWAAACFIEKLIDANLIGELFSEEDNPFAPLLEPCASSLVPLGWVGSKFHFYAFEPEKEL